MRLYFKEHFYKILVFTAVVLIFALSFMLYHLPLAAVIYPALLSFFLIAVYVTARTVYSTRKHKELLRLKKKPVNLCENLSVFDTRTDRDYREIIAVVEDLALESKTISDQTLSDMLDYFTTWVHQIKTPISSMRLTLQGEDSAASRQLSDDLLRIEQYVEMVLCYIRLGSDTTDYVFRECNLDDIVKAGMHKFASRFIGKGIRLEYTLLEKQVVTDEKWLSFVVEQVISNALKYTVSGSISVYTEGDVLCIKDTGIGIYAEDLPRIFEKGYTGYNGRADKKASGLGLYLCKRICKNLGFNIYAQSVVGVGTCIKIDLSQKSGPVE